jgi:ribosomal protein S6--L-glutamate ligase
MKIIILADNPGWHAGDLRRAAVLRGDVVESCSWLAMAGAVGFNDAAGVAPVRSNGSSLSDADAVLVRTMPPGTLEQVVFRMDLLHRLAAAGVPVVNSPRAIETAVDKYLALAKLEAAGLPVPATIACQRYGDAMAAFETLGRDVVIKPIFGSEGFGMTRISDGDLAARAFAQLERMGSVIYLQRFIDHGGSDLRLFVIAGQLVAAMRRASNTWRTNAARGARTEPLRPDPALAGLAVAAARACGCDLAGVDIVLDKDGAPFVLEVNAAPGWRAIAPTTGIDIASLIIAHLAAAAAAREPAHAAT